MTGADRFVATARSLGKERESILLGERLLKSRTILLAESVRAEIAEEVCAKLLLLDQESETKPIDIFINSPGGDVDAGFAIYDMVRFITASVRCISSGLTASAAVVVLLAAAKGQRLSFPNSRFLIHQPSAGVRGSTADIQIEAKEIVKMRERINQLIAEETGQPMGKIEKDTRRNYWMTAKEAREYGLIGKIIKSKSEISK